MIGDERVGSAECNRPPARESNDPQRNDCQGRRDRKGQHDQHVQSDEGVSGDSAERGGEGVLGDVHAREQVLVHAQGEAVVGADCVAEASPGVHIDVVAEHVARAPGIP